MLFRNTRETCILSNFLLWNNTVVVINILFNNDIIYASITSSWLKVGLITILLVIRIDQMAILSIIRAHFSGLTPSTSPSSWANNIWSSSITQTSISRCKCTTIASTNVCGSTPSHSTTFLAEWVEKTPIYTWHWIH